MRMSRPIIAAIVAVACGPNLFAQNDPNIFFPAGGFSVSGSSSQNDAQQRYLLLTRTEVREELGIDEAQRRQLTDLSKELSAQSIPPLNADRRNQTAEEREQERQRQREALQRRIELQQEVAQRALDGLYAEQRGRLEQLFFQNEGARALLRSDVADQIKLTHAQMDTLKAMQYGSIRATFNNPPGIQNARQDAEKRMEELRKSRERFETEAFEILNADQRAAWNQLIGKKFVFRTVTVNRLPAAPRLPPAPFLPES